MEGRLVSHYRVLAQLGGGGMGAVYKAEDTRLKRSVALKFLPADLTRDPEACARFIQEAQAASALDHPNTCTIYDIDDTGADAGGQLFIVMACYEGGTLKERLARGVLPVNDAIEIAMQIARGLDQAHQAGIVHRDVKPANVMLTREGPDGVVKIVDFGVAKLVSVDVTGMTRAGVSLGTPAYMAPEQIQEQPIDGRADLWALGVVLYEMVTGRLPFGGDTPVSITHAIVTTTPVSVASLRGEVPAALDAVIRRALAKRAEDRYGSARELLQDLEAILPTRVAAVAGATTPVPPSERTKRLGWTRLAVTAGMIALAAAGGTIAWLLKRAADERRVDILITEITAAADADEYNKALGQLEELERRAPGDPRLAALEQRIAVRGTVTTQPDGTTVSVKPYAEPAAAWRLLGRTPIADVRLGRGLYRWKLEKEGYATLEVPNPGGGRGLPPLSRADAQPPNTILVRPQPLFLSLPDTTSRGSCRAAAFLSTSTK